MANYDNELTKIVNALGAESASTDDKESVRRILSNLASQSSNTTQSASRTNNSISGALSGLSRYVKELDYSNAATANFNSNIIDLSSSFANLVETIASGNIIDSIAQLGNLAKPFIELDQSLRNQINRDLALTGGLARNIRSTMIETAEETLRYGINVGNVTDSYVSFVTTLGRAVPLNKELLEDITMSAKASGVSMQEAGNFLAKLESYGLSIQTGPDTLKEMASTARSMGLTTNKFMAYAAENLKLINTLGFEKGIRGFTEIAAKASAIGYNLSTAAATAEKLFDIDSAVEMAAQLNVLGGDFGKLGNAIDLMFSPTNDMEGFTKELMNASKQFITFNESKNTFDVSPLDLRRAREFAKATGQSVEEVIESGKRLAKMEVIKDKISFLPNISDEERDLIGSLGTIGENGDVKIQGKLVSEMSSSELTSTLRQMKQEDAKGKMSERDILNEQLNMFSKMNNYLKAIALELGAYDDKGGLFTLLGDDLNDLVYDVTGERNESFIDDIANALVNNNTEGFSEQFDDLESKMTNSQLSQWNSIKQQFMGLNSAMSNGQGYAGAMNNTTRNLQSLQVNPEVTNNNNVVVNIDGIRQGFNVFSRDEVKKIKGIINGINVEVETGGAVAQ